MSSINKECDKSKSLYDECFNNWYVNDFLKGKTESSSKCEELFVLYKNCVWVCFL